jgi:uncharacterized membrane protein
LDSVVIETTHRGLSRIRATSVAATRCIRDMRGQPIGQGHERAVTAPGRRTETFSDSVFAINITLIGLELRLPSVPAGHLMAGVLRDWPVYLAYLTSFLSLAVAWVNHRAIFARIGRVSVGVTWMNMGLLLTAGLVPFLTRIVVEALGRRDSDDTRAALLFYGLVGVLISTAYLAFSRYLSRHPELLEPWIEPDYFQRITKRSLVGLFGWAAAGLLGYFTVPWIGVAVLVAVAIFFALFSGGPTYETNPAAPDGSHREGPGGW